MTKPQKRPKGGLKSTAYMVIYPVQSEGGLTLYRRERRGETSVPLYVIHGTRYRDPIYGEYRTKRTALAALHRFAKRGR